MTNDWECALACTNSIKRHTAPASRHENPIGSDRVLYQTNGAQKSLFTQEESTTNPRPASFSLSFPFNKNGYSSV